MALALYISDSVTRRHECKMSCELHVPEARTSLIHSHVFPISETLLLCLYLCTIIKLLPLVSKMNRPT